MLHAKRKVLIGGWVIVILLAIGLRIWMWSFQARSGAVPPGDAEEYYRAALHLLQGGYHDTGKWLRPPIYPLLLAGWFRLFGVDLSQTLLAQAILSSMIAPACGWLAQRLFGSSRVALLSGLLAALFVPFASFGSVLFAESLFVLLIVLALAAFDTATITANIRPALVAGILLGLAALTRAVALSFIPLVILLLLVAYRTLFGQRRQLALALILGATLVIGPWALRNAIVHQRLILSDTNGGISMWYGVVRSDAEQQAGEAQLWAIANPADRQSLALRWTVEKIVQDPLWFAGRMRFKIASLYLLQVRSFAVGDSITVDSHDQLVAISAGEHPLSWSAVADSQYLLIMLMAIVGICFAPQRRRLLPLLLWVVFITFMSAVTIGHPRLRLPIIAVLIPCAAYGMALAWNWLRGVRSQKTREQANQGTSEREHQEPSTTQPGIGHPVTRSPRQLPRRRLAFMLAGWLVFLALIFSTRYLTWVRTWPDLQRGNAALANNEYNAARSAFEHAQVVDPTNALRVINLADLAFLTNDYLTALALYSQANALEDRNLYAHAMRARIAGLLGQPEVAAEQQRALAGYGRDNNELYDWAWRSFDDPPLVRVVPGDPQTLGQYVGFAPSTGDLPDGRWTLRNAQIRLANACGQLIMRVRGPQGRVITIGVEGSGAAPLVNTFTLDGTEQELQVALACSTQQTNSPDPVKRSVTTVSIDSATSLLDIETAPWYVGVAVLDAHIEAP